MSRALSKLSPEARIRQRASAKQSYYKKRATWTENQLAEYNRKGKERALKWRKLHPEKFRLVNKISRRKRRIRSMQMVMDVHGIQGCMVSIHPNIPDDLKEHTCWGKLTLEHPNGGGRKEWLKGRNTLDHILGGRRDPKELLILCQLHQIWNSYPTHD